MRITTFGLILVQVFIISCQVNNSTANYSLKDSILKEHLFALDSLPYYDTTEINYKVLKAFQNNDTSFLKKLHSDIERDRKFAQQMREMDSCIQQIKLEDLNCDEAYRFIYSGPFCPMKQITTISKLGDSINLNFELYQVRWDAMECKKIDAFNKKITPKNWEEMTRLIDRDDFLGLKRENNIHGLDGSTLVVIGYAKEGFNHIEAMKYHYVYRWSSSILRDAFELVTKLSANNQGCLTIK